MLVPYTVGDAHAQRLRSINIDTLGIDVDVNYIKQGFDKHSDCPHRQGSETECEQSDA